MEQETGGLWPSYDTWLLGKMEALQETGWLGYFIGQLIEAPYNILFALTHPGLWLDWSNKEAIMRFVYFGGSVELFFAVLFLFLIVTAAGLYCTRFMWGCVRVFEAVSNRVGRTMAWSGLIMVLVQILVIFMQRVFAVVDISLGFGAVMTHEVSWWAESLKFYNAIIVALCVSYTFIQGGHVRVDLVYAPVSFRVKKTIDMIGSLLFMVPIGVLIWMYSWFFMWRHLIVPKPTATDALERLLMKSRALRWNVEYTSFSPNGFNAYFMFKVLLVSLAGLVLLQAVTFFYRSLLELREGEASKDKYLDHDAMDDAEQALHAAGH